MDYALESLSPRSFEHLIQALALKYVGIGGLVFGDGADNGREATFSGQTIYDTGGGPWNGYVVLQAKFRQRLRGTTADGQWLLGQLQQELSDFTKGDSPRKLPEFYLLTTNVSLGGGDGGYKDRVQDALSSTDGFDLAGFDVWDYDKIRALLDDSPDIVRTYCAWISTGDVLHTAMAALDRQTPDFESTLSRYLQSELQGDQFANLEQAGHSPDERIPMASVFVDLPVGDSPNPTSDEDEPAQFVHDVLELAHERLCPSCERADDEGSAMAPAARIALVGGPGQGKTTLGQFVCQLFRAAIILDRSGYVDPDSRAAAEQVRDWCAKDGYDLPRVRRFPLRLTLSEFATALSEDPDSSSVMAYVTKRIATRTSRNVDIELFREWLSNYPWVLVLDGLDEVPPSSNRTEVLAAIRDFMIELGESDADVLTIATTRPQGYSDDFNPKVYRHRYLLPLAQRDALRYGDRLAEVRFGENDDRVRRVKARLSAAVENETTARLMTSPLQVTIMTILVDKQGHPPQERWSLFSAYYSAIYSRELERDVPTSRVLRDQRANVDAIHRRVGLLLQAESERAAGTDARLSSARFRAIVRARLVEEGFEDGALDEVEDEIVEAAANRLVFLVGLQAGLVGFEIRSLQEFMAAEGLMEADDGAVRSRLGAIAASPSWRNVFLFAVGRCFADRQYLRDAIHTMVAELNESSDPVYAVTLAGSRLALDILEEGTAAQQPKYAQLFARQALRLLELPVEDGHAKLASAYRSVVERPYREEISEALRKDPFPRQLAAWRCVVGLAANDVPWATEMCVADWPSDTASSEEVLRQVSGRAPSGEFRRFLEAKLAEQAPWTLEHIPLADAFLRSPGAQPWLVALRNLVRFRQHRRWNVRGAFDDTSLFAFDFPPLRVVDDSLAHLRDAPGAGPAWDMVRAIGQFAAAPGTDTAALAIRAGAPLVGAVLPTRTRSAYGPLVRELRWLSGAPWPITAMILSSKGAEDVLSRADSMEAGEFGSSEDWERSESTWAGRVQNCLALFAEYDPDNPLICEESGVLRFPVAALEYVYAFQAEQPTRPLAARIEPLREPGRMLAAEVALQSLRTIPGRAPIADAREQLEDCLQLLDFTNARVLPLHVVRRVERIVSAAKDGEALDDQLVRLVERDLRMPFFPGLRLPAFHLALVRLARSGVVAPGLLRLLAPIADRAELDGTALLEHDFAPDHELQLLQYAVSLDPERTPGDEAARTLAPLIGGWFARLVLVREAALRNGAPDAWLSDFLLAYMETGELLATIIEDLVGVVGRRLSPLASERAWVSLGLFSPPPAEQVQATA